MEKVYVLVDSWQFDSGEVGEEIEVFDTFEKAQEEFKKRIKTARQEMNGMFDSDEIEETDPDVMSFSIFEKEEYCYNHIDINIYEKEIK